MRLLPDSPGDRRRALFLVGLLALLVAWVWWPSGTEPVAPAGAPASAALPSASTGTGAAAEPNLDSITLPERVQLATLGNDHGAVTVGRNIFRFGARPAPPPPPPSEMPAPMVPAAPPRPTGPPPVPLRFTGRFEAPDGQVIATLKDQQSGALFHATEGEIVDGRYRLIKVGAQSVVVAYLDGSGQRTLGLGGG